MRVAVYQWRGGVVRVAVRQWRGGVVRVAVYQWRGAAARRSRGAPVHRSDAIFRASLGAVFVQ